MRQRFLLALSCAVLAATSGAASAAERPIATREQRAPKSGLVFGPGHAFWLTAPRGWVLDNQAGVDRGLQAVFYPEGSTWEGGPVVMYAHAAVRDTASGETLESFISQDVADTRKESASVRVAQAPPLETQDGKQAQVLRFSGDRWGNREAVAYVPERRVFVILTLTARSPEAFQRSLPAFEALVGSYAFFTEQVVLRP